MTIKVSKHLLEEQIRYTQRDIDSDIFLVLINKVWSDPVKFHKISPSVDNIVFCLIFRSSYACLQCTTLT